jgi:hypothetical protein
MILNGASQSTVERYIWLLGQASELEAGWRAVKDYRAYYAGDHPVYLTPRQEEFLGPLLTHAEHTVAFNVTRAVVDTLRERLCVEGFTGNDAAGETLAEKCAEWWRMATMDKQQITVHRRALRDGATYLILAWDDERSAPVWVPNHKFDGVEGVTLQKDVDTGKVTIALKYWSVNDPLSERHGQKRRTVYLPDRILKYKEAPRGQYGWELIDADEGEAVQWWTDTLAPGGKPLGVACVEFANPGGVSEIESLIGLQNALNKVVLDLLAAGDATGFQLLSITYPGPLPAAPVGDEDATSDDLQIAPGRVTELGDGATMQAIPPGDLSQLIATIRTLVAAMGATSRTPQYYLWPQGGADVPSGEALKQLESALIARATERTILFGDAWVEAMRLGARLYNAMGYSDVDAEGQLETNWGSVEVRNDFIDMQVAEGHQRLGVPQEVLWERKLGYSPDDVNEFKRMAAQDRARQLTDVLTSLGGANGNGANGNNRAATSGVSGNGAVGRANGESNQNGAARG